MKNAAITAPALILGMLLTGSVTAAEPTSSKHAMPGATTEEKSEVGAEGKSAAAVKVSTITATVESVDPKTRMVGIVGPDGKSFVLQAGEHVRNLAQVKVGDKVKIEYYEGLVAEMQPPGTPGELSTSKAMARAKPGERPAGAVGEAVTATVVIDFVDTLRDVVHFTGPLGKTHIVKVKRPQFKEMLKKLKPGDKVNLTYFEAVAVSVEPAKK